MKKKTYFGFSRCYLNCLGVSLFILFFLLSALLVAKPLIPLAERTARFVASFTGIAFLGRLLNAVLASALIFSCVLMGIAPAAGPL
jgi:hypothetical protein